MTIAVPMVNGCYYSFASIEAKFKGQIFLGIKSINYNRTRSRAKPRGTHPDPLGKTRGDNEYTADCEMYLPEFAAFVRNVIGSDDLKGYGDVFFDVTVTYNEEGLEPIVDEIIGCSIDSTDASNSQGTDATTRKFDLNPIKIRYFGADDLARPLAPPGG